MKKAIIRKGLVGYSVLTRWRERDGYTEAVDPRRCRYDVTEDVVAIKTDAAQAALIGLIHGAETGGKPEVAAFLRDRVLMVEGHYVTDDAIKPASPEGE